MDVRAMKGTVYFIGEQAGAVKIGWTANDPRERLRSCQTGNPRKLRLLSTIRFRDAELLERLIHTHFSSARLRGEWFKATPELLAFATGQAVPARLEPVINPKPWNGRRDLRLVKGTRRRAA